MSPILHRLADILADAAAGDSEGRTMSRLRRAGFTPDHTAVTDFLAATRDLAALTDDPTLARTLVPGLAHSAAVNPVEEARTVLERRCDEAVVALSRRPSPLEVAS